MAYLLTSGIFVLLKSKLDRMHFTPGKALELLTERNEPFLSLIEHGSMRLEIYKPDQVDLQTPHDQDEVYVVISGTGEFLNGEDRVHFGPGDFLFVPAGIEHRFVNFTEDFSTWVIFYGPKGGESKLPKEN
jgi:mannose-6-phosphate isomerase-like protein (cupin superfamily)